MREIKQIELLKHQLSKLDNDSFDFHQWNTNTSNIFKKIFEDSEDKILQLRACMNKPIYMISGIDVNKLKEDWRKLLLDYIEEIELLKEIEEPVQIDGDVFVHRFRIVEIENIKNESFDLLRLTQLCKEIDFNYYHQNYLSVVIIGRAIIDHVPPIFGLKTFNEVANNYGGNSFKKNMDKLNTTMRNLADMYLHGPIRKKETLPNKIQVNFSSELDLLLSEVVRVLK